MAELGYGCGRRRGRAADYKSAISANETILKTMRTERRLINPFCLIWCSKQPVNVLSVRNGEIIGLFHKIKASESAYKTKSAPQNGALASMMTEVLCGTPQHIKKSRSIRRDLVLDSQRHHAPILCLAHLS